MDGEDIGEFLDLLYAAAIDPPLWVPAMERLADMLGGSSAWLSRLNVADGTGTGIIARIDPVMPAAYQAHFASRNPFTKHRDPHRYIRGWTPRIRFHGDFLSHDEVVRTEFYNDFLRPQHIADTMMFGLASEGLETCVLNINHPSGVFEQPQIELARRLEPHLRRAFALSQTLGDGSEGRGVAGPDAVAVLDALQHAVFVVDAIGRVRHANAAAATLAGAGAGLRVDDGVLCAADAASARRLAAAIGAATARDAERRGGASVDVACPGGGTLTASVTPLRGGDRGVFATAPRAMVAVDAPRDASSARIRKLYDLTAAETRVAMALLDGCSPREAAARFGVSVQTIRNQLQSLYDKTATSRQSALVLLLAKVGA